MYLDLTNAIIFIIYYFIIVLLGLLMQHLLVEIQCSELCSGLDIIMERSKKTQDETYVPFRMSACPGKFDRLCSVYTYYLNMFKT